MKFYYYKKIECDEERLYDVEIARLYRIFKVTENKEGNVISKNPYAKLVEIIIDEYIERNSIEFEELYYPISNGISRVIPKHIYEPAVKEFLDTYQWYNVVQHCKYNGNLFKFIWFK